MAKIFFEAEKLVDMYCGLGQYCYHLFSALQELERELFALTYPDLLQKWQLPGEPLYRWKRKLPSFLRLNALFAHADLYHITHQDSLFFNMIKSKKKVLTIHDLNFLHEKNYLDSEKMKAVLQEKINSIDGIVYISHFTRSEVHRHFNIPARIDEQVIYNGVKLLSKQQSVEQVEKITGQYLFSIGTVVKKKNFHVLIPLLKKLPEDFSIVLAGSLDSEYAKQMQKDIERERLSGRFILLDKVSEEQKTWLYANCRGFVFPSLLEGFGIPVVEAMSFGKPLFLSSATSIPEIAGDDAFYFNDFSASCMEHTIHQGLLKFSEQQAEALKKRAASFTWQKSAKEYSSFYQRVLAN